MSKLTAVAFVLLAAAVRADEPPGSDFNPPNIVLVFTDDQGYHDLGVQDHETIRTPRIDRMAAEGMRFTDFYVAASICIPSRRSLMTGRYPVRKGVTGPRCTILPEILKQAGYATALIGKWHLGTSEQAVPTANGFDYFYGTLASNNDTTQLWRDTEVIEDPFDNNLLTQKYTRVARTFIDRHKDKPFFLYLAHNMPHWPIGTSDDFQGKSKFGRPYGDAIEELDWSVGQVLDVLREHGLDDKTLVIYTSDNGPRKADGGSASPLTGNKWGYHEGSQRVPCIMRWPGKIPAGRVCRDVASTMDFLATFAALAGQELSEQRVLDGHDIWPLMSGRPDAKSPWSVFFYYGSTSKVPLAARSGKWKYDFQLQRLYNLQQDIGETTDLFDQHPDLVSRFRAMPEVINEAVQCDEAASFQPIGDPKNHREAPREK